MSKSITTRRDKLVKDIVTYIILAILLLLFIFPVYWTFITSIKFTSDAFTSKFLPFLQFQPTLKGWRGQLGYVENLKALLNSTIIGVSSAALATFLGSMAGYALARFKFKKIKNADIITWFLSLRIMPPIAIALPIYALMLYVKLLDTQLAVILVHTAFFLPYAVLVSRDAFRSIPIEIEESALVDGCTRTQVFFRIALPLIAPALAAIFILTFSFSWNEFLFAFVLTRTKAVTMPVYIAGTVTTVGVLFDALSVRAMLAIIPPVILGLLVQRYIVSGLTMGAIKG
ncbi:carbohydrate ABC transporter permease [Candidatus Bathyarchaeota archaeon]|nr:MAG: carbohydrate ABC transporter permease [Candidatus Bathyarchaeota archaeon]